jgi:DNA-binding transcriptional LysR family regulator
MEVFRAVMLTGTVAAAADILHVSHPTVSKALALGERRTGLRLFERVKGRLIPTPEGRRLYEDIEQLWDRVEKLRTLSRELATPSAGKLNIVASPSLGSAVIPAVVAALQREIPDLKFAIRLLTPNLLQDAILDRTVDVAVGLFRITHPNVTEIARYDCGWVCVMAKGHPLAKKTNILPRDLVGFPVISFPAQPAYGVMPEILFGNALGKLKIQVEVGSGQTACLFSLGGAGVSVVDELSAMNATFPQLDVRPFRTKAKLSVHVARNTYQPLSKIARRFCELIDVELR